jgi:restriction system protein
MPIPDYQTLMLPLLKYAAIGATRVLDAEKKVGEEFGLTPEEREQLLPSGKQRVLHNRAHWAKFYLMKAGLVTFPSRGTFTATDAGRALLSRDPSRIDIELLRQYPPFEEFYRGSHAADGEKVPDAGEIVSSPSSATPLSSTPEEQIEKAFLTIQSALRTELLERILQNTPAFFEGLIIDLLVKMGYGGSRPDAAAQLGRSGDGGVDGVINEDRLGYTSQAIFRKHYWAARCSEIRG